MMNQERSLSDPHIATEGTSRKSPYVVLTLNLVIESSPTVVPSTAIKDDLTLGLGLQGDGFAYLKRKIVECYSWNVLGSHSAERHLFGLVEKDAW